MFSLDPRPDLFRTRLPDKFIEPNILTKYDAFIKQKPFVFDSFIDVMNESIQSFDIPAFGFSATIQDGNRDNALGAIERVHVPHQSVQKFIDNTFTITFKHTEAYMSYWFMVEHWFKKYQLGKDGNRVPMDFLLLELLDYKLNSIVRIKFNKVLFTGVDGVSFAYNNIDRTSDTFTATFQYGTLQPVFDIPTLNIKT
ncbi:hypothetical protein HYO65_gp244 [Tenacibaculum phage PTm1]|uniref:Uncharacterized protein n=2 Tax=Shirahamavirus PTm1 TaxID=2846435 RepID=A0A5S9HXC4_9CAUD|nr:hypothetical protein HYO65_gp244 [Tenacibaculum phage PTm1]BBI90636.1 hypothetical protein [Tenacibaculum phage PTm1]BBI90943.1 hypothetical protein [Tenacibaculum phage PTm5]